MFRRQLKWLVAMAAVSASMPALAGPPPHVDVVVNGKVPPQELHKKAVRAVFQLRAQFWTNGQPIVLVLQSGDAELHSAFCAAVLEAPCSTIEEAELEKRYQGDLFAQVVVASSPEEAAAVLKKNPNAIGYVRRGTAPADTRVVLQP